MSSNVSAAIEIGTTRTVLAVGERKPDGRVSIIGIAETPSTGVRKSQIIDVSQATQAISSVLRKAENDFSVSVNNATLVVSGPHIQTHCTAGTWQTGSKTITQDDTAEVWDNAQESLMRELDTQNREILQISDLDYTLDDRPGITNPVGMSGRLLKHNILGIHGSKSCIESTNNATASAQLETPRRIFAGYCAAMAVLTPEESANGALVIDLGGGSTTYAIFENGRLQLAGVIGVGGDHVTNDIALAFQTTNAQAETLKKQFGAANVASGSDDHRVTIPSTTPGFDQRTVSHRALCTVINARMDELLRIILEILEDSGYHHRLNSGVILTGGGAAMSGLTQLSFRRLGLPTRVGFPKNVDGLENVSNPSSYATIAGALIYSCRDEETTEGGGFLGFLKRIFK